jgi:phage tail sheath protein FI
VSAAKNGDANYFDAQLLDANGVEKRYWTNNITTTTDPDYFEDKWNDDPENHYVTVTDALSGTAPANRPTNGTYTLAAGDSGLGALADTDFVGNSAGPTGLYGFDTTANARTLIVPGKASSTGHNGMVTYCDTWRNTSIVPIADFPEGYTDAQARTYWVTTASLKGSSEMLFGAWPRGHIVNPRPPVLTNDGVIKNNRGAVNIPLSGHIAGSWARNDAVPGGVYQPPAGSDLILRGVLGVEIIASGQEDHPVDDARKRANCYDDLFNCVRKGTGGVYVDGTRMAKSDGSFPTIGQRRGACHIKLTVEAGVPFAIHKNIKAPLLRKIDRSVRIWLELQTDNGAFVSDDYDEAFDWNVGLDINPPSVQLTRKIKASLGLAFAEPADFVDLELYRDIRRYEEELARG